MSHRINRTVSLMTMIGIVASLSVPAVACARIDDAALASASRAATVAAPASTAATVPAPTATAASAQLAADLAFMLEEERLAHDVYTELGEKWDVRIFTNIATSEQRHTDSIAALMTTYKIAAPEGTPVSGTYENDALQALYNDLIAQGSVSVEEAMKVGRLIEQTDIADLDERIARTSEADVKAVLENLRAGSVNHLAAFDRQIDGTTGAGQGAGGQRGNRGGRN